MENEKKDNTSLIIIGVVAVLLLVGLVTYFIMNSDNKVEDKNDTNVIENNDVDDNETNDVIDVTGAYSGEFDKDESLVDDIEDTVTGDKEKAELVLSDDGTAKIALSDTVHTGTYTVDAKRVTIIVNDNKANDTTTTDGTTDKTTDETADETTDTTNTTKTYEFTINDDDTLTYQDENNRKVTLKKTDKDKLEYIK